MLQYVSQVVRGNLLSYTSKVLAEQWCTGASCVCFMLVGPCMWVCSGGCTAWLPRMCRWVAVGGPDYSWRNTT